MVELFACTRELPIASPRGQKSLNQIPNELKCFFQERPRANRGPGAAQEVGSLPD